MRLQDSLWGLNGGKRRRCLTPTAGVCTHIRKASSRARTLERLGTHSLVRLTPTWAESTADSKTEPHFTRGHFLYAAGVEAKSFIHSPQHKLRGQTSWRHQRPLLSMPTTTALVHLQRSPHCLIPLMIYGLGYPLSNCRGESTHSTSGVAT